eukprot:SAG11_NODE_992_length_6262_cov_2.097193_6_plen_166_part_00
MGAPPSYEPPPSPRTRPDGLAHLLGPLSRDFGKRTFVHQFGFCTGAVDLCGMHAVLLVVWLARMRGPRDVARACMRGHHAVRMHAVACVHACVMILCTRNVVPCRHALRSMWCTRSLTIAHAGPRGSKFTIYSPTWTRPPNTSHPRGRRSSAGAHCRRVSAADPE